MIIIISQDSGTYIYKINLLGSQTSFKLGTKRSGLCAGFMTTYELKNFESLHSDFNKYWMPLTWFSNLASRAREEGRVRDDIALRLLMDVSGQKYLLCIYIVSIVSIFINV